VLLSLAVLCSARSFDVLSTDQNGVEIVIAPIHHASLMLQFKGKAIFIDPAGPADFSGMPKPDYIFITDIHGDHLSPPTIESLKKDSTVIVGPEAVAEKLAGVVVMNNGDRKEFGEIGVEAVPMYNLKRGPQPGTLYHPKGRGNGYIFTLANRRFYVSGDTEAIPEMRALRNIDVAFVCMNLPYTMTPQEAAEAVTAFHPRIVYPYHYKGSDVNAFAAALTGVSGVEVRLRKWY
jgi:L-ascorbate metabolism protein UlaG (beta-lactamase superfamily)